MAEEKQNTLDLDFYLSRYVVPVLEWKWVLIILTVGFFCISFVVSLFIKPEFTSMATILVEEPRSNISVNVSKDVAPRKAEGAYVVAETEKIMSDSFAEEVLNIMPVELKADLEIPLSIGPQLVEGIKELIKNIFGKSAVDLFKKMLGRESTPATEYLRKRALLTEARQRVSVTSNAGRATIWITGRTLKKELAPVLVKSYIDVWTAVNLEESKKGIRAEREFSQAQREEANQKFLEAERDLIEFKKKYEIPTAVKIAPDITIQLEMQRLQSRIEAAKDRFDLMDRVFLETRRKEEGIVGNIKILNPPAIPLNPSKSSGNKIILFGTLIGPMLGLLLILGVDYLRGSIRHESEITSAVNIPIIGTIPKV
ncbi:MAG: hypothetical protein C4576_27135 [Desulfobacteraceae bacterium]|nr:MAG: hypothetical protein C4576_27135 [Desulfobacteraceae bacterium]